jgi:ABC-type antimicrobial peptide transport system ATPase subunit
MVYKGIWFYGLSGVGKSYISKIIKKSIKKSFEIDGDFIRSTLSKDLDYSLKSRKIQIVRILNISKLCIINNYFPIASTVYMNHFIFNECKKNFILIVKVERENFENIKCKHETYKNKKNVVGKDIKLPNVDSYIINNPGDKKICKEINLLKKLLKKNVF